MADLQPNDSDESAIAWVSFSDIFLLMTVLMLALCFVFAQDLASSRVKANVDKDIFDSRVKELEVEIAALLEERGQLQTRAVELEKRLKELGEEAQKLLEAAYHRIGVLTDDLAAARQDREVALEAVDRLRAEVARLQQEQADLRTRFENEGRFRQELLGLRGDLGRVLFVFDHSSSMTTPRPGESTAAARQRWDQAIEIARSWMELLPVREAALILFSDRATPFPRDRTMLALTSSPENRKLLVRHLDQVVPEGETELLGALKLAHSYTGVDSIILFTDGLPTSGRLGAARSAMDEIHAFLRAQREAGSGVPINVIGLGDYLGNTDLGPFLRQMAEETEGCFLGR